MSWGFAIGRGSVPLGCKAQAEQHSAIQGLAEPWISVLPSLLLIKMGSGDEPRPWPAAQMLAPLFACSPAPSCLGQIAVSQPARAQSKEQPCQGQFPPASGDSSSRDTRGGAKPTALWKPHGYFRNNPVLVFPRDTLSACFSQTKDCITNCSFCYTPS